MTNGKDYDNTDLTRLIRVDNADQTYTIPGTVTSVASGFIGRDTVKQVTFQGNAPSFDSEAFALVDAMAVYPENDATWTDEVKQQYGGTIDWRSTGEQIVQSGAMSGLVGWELLQNGTLVISGTGDMPTKSYSQYPWYAYRSQIKKVVIEPGITSVAEYAFYSTYYPNLTTVSLPEGLESIDDYAFQKLSSLVEINIPSTVTGIGDYAFDRCASLASLTIQPGVKSIGSNAFSDCDALTSVTIPGTVETVGYGAFEDCGKLASVVIEDGVTDLGQYAFAYCPVLTDVTLPDSITTMNTACFRADPMLKAFKIPSGVTVLRQYLFYGCTSLGVVTIPTTVTEIENGAFYGCTIERVIFEDFVPTIHSASFTNVETPVYYPLDNENWTVEMRQDYGGTLSWRGYRDGIIELDGGTCGDNLSWSLWDDGSLHIFGDGDMYDYDEGTAPWYSYRDTITSAVMDPGVTGIGDYAFYDLTNLASISMAESTARIGFCAFSGCTALNSITVPAGVVDIFDFAFYGLSEGTEVTFLGDAPAFGDFAFSGATVTAYYTCGNTTWTKDVLAQYDGTITWEAVGEHTAVNSHSCSLCGKVLSDHDYSGVKTAPQCEEQGFTTYTCSICLDSYVDDYVAETGHTPVTDAAKDPTCTATGLTEGSHCSVCSKVLVAQKTVEELGHSFENGLWIC